MQYNSLKNLVLAVFLAFMFFSIPSVRAEVTELDNDGLKRLVAEGVVLVDIRRPDEWQQTGTIAGSHLITFFHDKEYKVFDMSAWLLELHKIAKPEQPVILICRSGNRTKSVSNYLDQKAGYTKVYNVTEGITRWIKDGNPVAPYLLK